MTRFFGRLTFTILVCVLAAAPAFAVPHGAPLQLSVSAPRPASPLPGAPLELLGAPIAFGMAIRVKDLGSIAKKFVQRASAAAPDYKDGVAQAGGDWETNTKASEDNYAQGTQAAIADKRFGKGVAAAGAAKYMQKATTLGAQRYAPGIAAAEGEFSKGMAPVLQAIAGITLPPRRPKGDPGNMERANVVARTLRQLKTGR